MKNQKLLCSACAVVMALGMVGATAAYAESPVPAVTVATQAVLKWYSRSENSR